MTSTPDSGPQLTRDPQLTMELSPADLPRIEVTRNCPVCGTGAPISDLFCQTCGMQLTNDRNHYSEQPGRWLAATTDRGRRHHRNEDASATDADEAAGFGILVVCDGVSSAQDTDLASLVGARAARDRLRSLRTGSDRTGHGTDDRGERISAALIGAVEAAHQAVLGSDRSADQRLQYAAAAVIDAELIGWASVGDSRVYWLPDQDVTPSDRSHDPAPDLSPRLLSHDDSIAELQIAAGVPRDDAEHGPQAHSITNWIGHQAPESAAEIGVFAPQSSGWLIVCSDGLWNYASDPAALRDVLNLLLHGLRPGALALADALVRWAGDQGGADNVDRRAGPVPARRLDHRLSTAADRISRPRTADRIGESMWQGERAAGLPTAEPVRRSCSQEQSQHSKRPGGIRWRSRSASRTSIARSSSR